MTLYIFFSISFMRQVMPTGSVHFKVRQSGEHFSWVKPTTTIHNIILGQLWNDQVSGNIDGEALPGL
jgi:hypothetical protein